MNAEPMNETTEQFDCIKAKLSLCKWLAWLAIFRVRIAEKKMQQEMIFFLTVIAKF